MPKAKRTTKSPSRHGEYEKRTTPRKARKEALIQRLKDTWKKCVGERGHFLNEVGNLVDQEGNEVHEFQNLHAIKNLRDFSLELLSDNVPAKLSFSWYFRLNNSLVDEDWTPAYCCMEILREIMKGDFTDMRGFTVEFLCKELYWLFKYEVNYDGWDHGFSFNTDCEQAFDIWNFIHDNLDQLNKICGKCGTLDFLEDISAYKLFTNAILEYCP